MVLRNLDHTKASRYQMLSCICPSPLHYWLWSCEVMNQHERHLVLHREHQSSICNWNTEKRKLTRTFRGSMQEALWAITSLGCKYPQWGNSAARTLGNDLKQTATDCWELTIQTYKPLFFLCFPDAVLCPEDSAVNKTRSLPSENLHWGIEDRWLTTKQVGTRVLPLYPRSPADAWNHG